MKYNITNYKYSGFFLIELIVAISIFSLTCLLIANFHAFLLEEQYEAIKYNQALNLANSLMDQTQLLGFKNSSFIKDGFQIEISNPINIIKKQNSNKSFNLLNLSISWLTLKKIKRNLVFTFGIIS